MNEDVTQENRKKIFKTFFLILVISFILGGISFFTCDFAWGSTPAYCNSAIFSIISLPTFIFKAATVWYGVLFSSGQSNTIEYILIPGFILQILFTYLLARMYVYRKEIAIKCPKIFLVIFTLVFLYFAWIPSGNIPHQLQRLDMGNTSHIDTEGSEVTSTDPSSLLKYSLIWPIAPNLDSKTSGLNGIVKAYVISSLVIILILTVLINTLIFKKPKNA